MLPMAIAAIGTATVGYLNWKRNQSNELNKQQRYEARLEEIHDTLSDLASRQRLFYEHNFPSPDVILNDILTPPLNRLWERRLEDADFGMTRLGLGRVPSSITLAPPNASNIDSPQLAAALKLVEEFSYLQGVPVAIPLGDVHAIGITSWDNDYQAIADFVRAMVGHMAAMHLPDDIRFHIIGAPNSKNQWKWAAWLPHANLSPSEDGAGDQLNFDPSNASDFWSALRDELEHRRSYQEETEQLRNRPLLVVVVDLFNITNDDDNPINDLEAEVALSMLFKQGRELGASIVFLVPNGDEIPGECQAVIEVGKKSDGNINFRYAETGVNTRRLDGVIDRLSARQAEHDLARKLSGLAVRTSYSADLAAAVNLLDMFDARAIEDMEILRAWRNSRQPTQEWPSCPIGTMMGGRPRELVFSQDADGVHGLVAGTTGSGKSELLVTMIVGLAAKYDPSIVNFVLVDYKGGTAFEVFRRLPHTVDVITNLHGRAGERMFTAIKAELDRRSSIIAAARESRGESNIARYHAEGLHLKQPLPQLFIIIDEFAEMIRESAEFKDRLESVARLGRALGVHLILATQSPTGVVSDQIRTNMKFRICLRVETTADSSELLRRTDAAFLPDIPGRAYIQVGGEGVELLQTAYAGMDYRGSLSGSIPDIVWLDRNKDNSTISLELREEKLFSVLILYMANLADASADVQKQPKPWPDPLRPLESLASHLNPALQDWIDSQGEWRELDWNRNAMRAVIGILDVPDQALQIPLEINLSSGHLAVFGTSGAGKTMLLQSMILSLVATHSPEDLQIYALDFGGGGLSALNALPHVGHVILSHEAELVRRLLRKLNATLSERQLKLNQAHAKGLAEYNKTAEQKLPAILLVIENIADFRENYVDEIDTLIALCREGRSYGIHVVVTAEQVSSLTTKLYNQFTERIALKLADPTEYSSVVGPKVRNVDDIPGRGFIVRERRPLEFQVATLLNADLGNLDSETEMNIADQKSVVNLASKMGSAWKGSTPPRIQELQTIISLDERLLSVHTPRGTTAQLGYEDQDLQPIGIELEQKGPHFLIIGPPISGKTTALRSIALSLCYQYSPDEIGLVLVDFQQRLFRYADSERNLSKLPHVLNVVSNIEQLEGLAEQLELEFSESNHAGRRIFVLIDNYDDLSLGLGMSNPLYNRLGELAHRHGVDGLHFIVTGSINVSRTNDNLLRHIKAPRYGLGLDASEAPQALNASRFRSNPDLEFPPGRGYLVKSGRYSLIQVAAPLVDNHEMEDSLDIWINKILGLYSDKARWTKEKSEDKTPSHEAGK